MAMWGGWVEGWVEHLVEWVAKYGWKLLSPPVQALEGVSQQLIRFQHPSAEEEHGGGGGEGFCSINKAES